MPSPVPADLLLPFRDFIAKYSLEPLSALFWGFTQGVGDILDMPTVYIMKSSVLSDLQSLQDGFYLTAAHDNLIYDSAASVLGTDVLYKATTIAVDRSQPHDINIVVRTPSGLELIKAKQMMIAIQLTLAALSP